MPHKKSPKSEEPPARDSGEVLLRDMKRTVSDPLIPVVTDDEVANFEAHASIYQSIPPSSDDSLRKKQIAAWNNMAEQMIKVVKTIKTNEVKLADTVSRIRSLVLLIGISVVATAPVSMYYNMQSVRSIERLEKATMASMAVSKLRQEKLFEAIAAVAGAQAVSIEADISYNPRTEKEAKAVALEAQQLALEVRADSVPPIEKPEIEDELEKVTKRAEEARADVPDPKPVE